MPDVEKVISDLEEQITWIRDNDFHKFPGWGHAVLAMRDAIALLKAQEQKCRECGEATSKAIQELQTKLKAQEQEPIVPIRRSAHAQGADDVWYECGKCGEFLGVNPYSKQFCANCGREVKWE